MTPVGISIPADSSSQEEAFKVEIISEKRLKIKTFWPMV